MQILYFTKEDRVPLDAAEGMLPFSYKVEVPGMKKEYRFEMDTRLELLSVMMKSSSMLELQAVTDFDVIVFVPEYLDKISGVTEEELNWEDLQKQPGMIGLRTKKGDPLWDIAKENHTTIDEIRKTNQKPEEPLAEGTVILILKQVR